MKRAPPGRWPHLQSGQWSRWRVPNHLQGASPLPSGVYEYASQVDGIGVDEPGRHARLRIGLLAIVIVVEFEFPYDYAVFA